MPNILILPHTNQKHYNVDVDEEVRYERERESECGKAETVKKIRILNEFLSITSST